MKRPNALMRAAFPAAILLSAGTLATGMLAAADGQPSPGQYEVTTLTRYVDVELPETTVTTQNCLTQEDLAKDPASVFAALPDGKTCSVGEFEMADGIIRMGITCAAPDGDLVMVTEGSYDESGYAMTSIVTITAGEQQVEMHSTIQGKLMGDC